MSSPAPLHVAATRAGLRKRLLPSIGDPIKEKAIYSLREDVNHRLDAIERGDYPDAPPIAPAAQMHQQIVRLPVSALLDVLSGRIQVTNLPDGAKLISSWYDSTYDGTVETERLLCLRIEHASLPVFDAGRAIPRVTAVLRKPMAREVR